MSLKSPFLVGSVCLAATGVATSSYFSLKNNIFQSSLDSKFSNLEYKITQLSDEDYKTHESSKNFIEIKNSIQEIVKQFEKDIGKERFKNTFAKALEYENLISNFPATSSIDSFKYSLLDLTKAKSDMKNVENTIKESEKYFYKKAKELNEICQKIVRKFENIKKLQKSSGN